MVDIFLCNATSGLQSDGVTPVRSSVLNVRGTIPVEIVRKFKGVRAGARWVFPLSAYGKLRPELKDLRQDIPTHVLALVQTKLPPQPDHKTLAGRIPARIWDALYPFQKTGVQFAVRRGGALLADDMGCGKTLQAIAISSFYSSRTCLVVCPSSLQYNWRAEILHWTDTDPQTIFMMGKEKNTTNIPAGTTRFIIVSYGLVIRPHALARLAETDFGLVIADESHYIKSQTSKRSKAVRKLCQRKGTIPILLSGTPMSRVEDLFPQLSVLRPLAFPHFFSQRNPKPDRFYFAERYCRPTRVYLGSNRFQYTFKGATHLDELNAVLEHLFMIRRTKKQALPQLPPKIRQQIQLPTLSARDTKYFQKELLSVQQMRLPGGAGSKAADGQFMELVRFTARKKAKHVACFVKELLGRSNGKILLFAHHKFMLDQLQQILINSSVKHMRIDGGTPVSRRADLVQTFQTDPEMKAAVLSISAAGVGLTLTRANLVVFAELLFSPKDMFQAEDRAYRIGQTERVVVKYLILGGSTDDVLWTMIENKARWSDRALQGDGAVPKLL